jgi:hypothetical protein
MPHLSPAHHETSKRDSKNETKIKIKQSKCPRFEFKLRQVNDSSQLSQGTDHLVSHKHNMFHNKQNKFTTIQFITHIIKQNKFIPNTYIIKNNYGAALLLSNPPIGLGLNRASTKSYPYLPPCDLELPRKTCKGTC